MENSSRNLQKVNRLNPLANLFLLITMLVGIMIYSSWRFSLVLLVIVLLLFPITGASLNLSRNRTRFILLFSLLLFVFQILVTVNGAILGFFIPSLNGFGPFIPITDYGMERGLSISLRFLLVVLSSMLFVSITDPTLLAHSLTKLRIPYRYSFALVIAMRFLPLFDSENHTVRLAQKSRGIRPEVGGIRKIFRTIQYTFFPLLVSALSRVESLAISMDGRGFGYSPTRTYFRKSHWKVIDTFLIILEFGFILLCIMLTWGYLPQLSLIL